MSVTGGMDRTFIDWLQDADAPPLPDRVYEAAFTQARRTSQSRPLPWSLPGFGGGMAGMRSHARTLIAVALVVLALGGIALALAARPVPPDPRIYRGVFEPAGRIGDIEDPSPWTLTELPDGSILVTDQANLRRFDPATRTFSIVGTLAAARQGETVTALGDGRMLIVGGGEDRVMHEPRPVDGWRAELYDPGTGKVTQTGTTVEPRAWGTATRLRDGRVLITGGEAQGFAVGSAEVYDPWTAQFSLTGPMTQQRSGHHAILLMDGRVLIIGGSGASGGTTELYDPATGQFTASAPLLVEQPGSPVVVLPDGGILLIGGYEPDGSDPTDVVQRYDPASGRVRRLPPLPGPRAQHAAAALDDGRVLVVGGVDARVHPTTGRPVEATDGAFIYDPVTGRSVATEPMSVPRRNPLSITLRDGRVLVVGHRPWNLERVPWGNDARRTAELFE